jgi:hypothetical protein
MFTRIDFGSRLRSCPGCRRQLIKPSELGLGEILKLSGFDVFVMLNLHPINMDGCQAGSFAALGFKDGKKGAANVPDN